MMKQELFSAVLIISSQQALLTDGVAFLRMEHPTHISYALLTNDYTIPADKQLASNTNCKYMQSFNKISKDIQPSDIKIQLRAALSSWERVANIVFIETKDINAANIIIGAEAHATGSYSWSLSPGIAFTNIAVKNHKIEQSYVCLNGNKKWKVGFDGNFSTYDLRHTFMHETGHAIGLDHPELEKSQIMSYRYDEAVKEPQTSDIEAIQKLYGKP
jgi:hypothetical protein